MEVTHLDHIYLTVSDIKRSEQFYDCVMHALGFKKSSEPINDEQHVHYINRHMQISLRPAKSLTAFDAYAPGLHHVCLQVPNQQDIDELASALETLDIHCSTPKEYPEYSDGYYAIFFSDPDNIRLEVVARTRNRELIATRWDDLENLMGSVTRI